jgi:hypothetical protein
LIAGNQGRFFAAAMGFAAMHAGEHFVAKHDGALPGQTVTNAWQR